MTDLQVFLLFLVTVLEFGYAGSHTGQILDLHVVRCRGEQKNRCHQEGSHGRSPCIIARS